MFFWATPALTSAQRVLLGDARFSPWPAGPGDKLSERQRRSEAAMMLLALRNVLRAAEWTIEGPIRSDLGVDVDKIMQEFHRQLPGVVDARDALEHFDEYAMGKGRLQRTEHVPYDFDLIDDPGPVVIVGPIRIDVRQAREACRWLMIQLLARMPVEDAEAADHVLKEALSRHE